MNKPRIKEDNILQKIVGWVIRTFTDFEEKLTDEEDKPTQYSLWICSCGVTRTPRPQCSPGCGQMPRFVDVIEYSRRYELAEFCKSIQVSHDDAKKEIIRLGIIIKSLKVKGHG